MGRRRQSRETALQLLYALDITRANSREVLCATWTETMLSPEIRDFTTTLVTGVIQRRDEIDAFIQECSTNWSLERIGMVERNICVLRSMNCAFCLIFLPTSPSTKPSRWRKNTARRTHQRSSMAFSIASNMR